ncbi:HAD family hydrolase [Pedobacter sp. P351]|uniref:HAD family hydrolase n=1 Tax=Pedobacter superstes TaxID=3133441 RepID=UPI0030B6368D
MKKKALIFDLDNTIYPVTSIGNKLFKSLFERIEESGEYEGDLTEIKAEIMRRPFQHVAKDYKFSESLIAEGMNLLSDLTYEENMEPFEGYEHARKIPCKKFLVTTGFSKLQHSKIRQLNIEKDFEKIVVVDPAISDLKKIDIFRNILRDYNYSADEVLVIGDDLNSEIKAAKELGIDAVLYDYKAEHSASESQKFIRNFKELEFYIGI